MIFNLFIHTVRWKRTFFKISLIGLCISPLSGQNTLVTKSDSVSYALGIMMAQNLKNQDLEEIDLELMIQALRDNKSGKNLLSQSDAMSCINNFMTERKEVKNRDMIEKQETYLVENAKRSEVVVLESGLQYEIVNSGPDTLSSPGPADKVMAHYHGMLVDGTVFDSSVDRGEPLSLPVNGVIKGWQEALQLMVPGDKWRLYIPYQLAYGERGAGGAIPPYATLIFDLELLSIE